MYQIEIKSEYSNGTYKAKYPYQVGNLLSSVAEATPGELHVTIEYEEEEEEDE